jgi:imidazolonepropionase-like amidohydrolase
MPVPVQRTSLLVTDHLFDGQRFVRGEHEIHIDRGVIACLRPRPAAQPLPPGAQDLRGVTLLPGLIDAHWHIARVGQFKPRALTEP